MPEISSNYVQNMPLNEPNKNLSPQPMRTKPMGPDEFFRREKRKNSGLIEKFYNFIKNATGLGVGSKKVEAEVQKAKNGEISKTQLVETVNKYNSSQETSAQLLGDAVSVGASGLTFFTMGNYLKKRNATILLNEKYVNTLQDGIKQGGKDNFWLKLLDKAADAAKSKKKLMVITALTSAFVGGYAKSLVLSLNRIGSKEFNADKKDYDGARTGYTKALYKKDKKAKFKEKVKSNFKNFASGAVNGLLMPIATVGGAIVGVPLYFVGNSLNRYFIGSKEKNKSFGGYVSNLSNDIVTTGLVSAGIAIPMVKKVNYTKVFDTNLKKAFEKLKGATLKESGFEGKTAYTELESILMGSKKVSDIVHDTGISVEDKINRLTNENIFAVKFKQISNDYSSLSHALRENCPPTRTLEEAQKMINEKLGSGYELTKLLGVGTVAETYLAKSPDGKEVCLKVLKSGITEEKILQDKEKFIEIIKNLSDKSEDEKKYLLRNVQDLAEGIVKEVDFKNEMECAQELVKYTKKANVVKPIEVKNGIYVMEKANGISLNSLVELNQANIYKDLLEKNSKAQNMYTPSSNTKLGKLLKGKKTREEKLSVVKDYIEQIQARTPEFGDINLTKSDAKKLFRKYSEVLVEQFNKVDKNGKVLHADIHPGNIFIDVNALKSGKGQVFTLIDTGNTVKLSAEQAIRNMNLSSYVKHANVPDIAEYVLEGAALPKGMTKQEAVNKLSEELKKCFFDSETKLSSLDNSRVLDLCSNIMKKYDIVPADTQLNLLKARKSADNSFDSMGDSLTMLALKDINLENSFSAMATLTKFIGELGLELKKHKSLQAKQEKLNLLQLPLETQIKFRNNPNNLKTNSEEYLTYSLKQSIKA